MSIVATVVALKDNQGPPARARGSRPDGPSVTIRVRPAPSRPRGPRYGSFEAPTVATRRHRRAPAGRGRTGDPDPHRSWLRHLTRPSQPGIDGRPRSHAPCRAPDDQLAERPQPRPARPTT